MTAPTSASTQNSDSAANPGANSRSHLTSPRHPSSAPRGFDAHPSSSPASHRPSSEPWLWDAVLDETGESREARRTRHAIAIGVCERCPVRRQCEADIDHEHDEGVRAGVLLRDKFGVRRSAA